MSVQIGTSSKNYTISGGSRVGVVTSYGLPYVVCINTTDNAVEMWQGSDNKGSSFSKVDTSNQPPQPNAGDLFKCAACCIDSDDIIHVVMYINNSTDTLPVGLYYTTFDASLGTDNWDGGIYQAATPTAASFKPTTPSVACAITNGRLQVAYTDMRTVRGVTTQYLLYKNYDIPTTTWSTPLFIKDKSAYPDILIHAVSDEPIISCIVSTDTAPSGVSAFLGNAANATIFTEKALASVKYQLNVYNQPHITQDSAGISVCYLESDGVYAGNPSVIRHLDSAAWSSWQTAQIIEDTVGYLYVTMGARGYGKFNRDRNVIARRATGVDPAYTLDRYTDFNVFNGG